MKRIFKSTTIATGLAMFSMFFGAGNVVFPLALGREAGNKNIFAMLGLLITAVGVPFLGLLGMILFDGDYKKFFGRIGRVPGFLLITIIVAMIGPFAAMPRCVTLSFSAVQTFFPGISLFIFALISLLLIFLLSVKENKILNILGQVLGPILIASLAIIIIKGIASGSAAAVVDVSKIKMFLRGLTAGYDTMDLLATGFFSAIVLATLKNTFKIKEGDAAGYKKLAFITLKASIIGASLLGIIYVGLSFAVSFQGTYLEGVGRDYILSVMAVNVLGPAFGIIASIAVALACLTTAIALAVVFSDYLRFEIFKGRLGYIPALLITLIITAIFSNFGFEGVMMIIHPMVLICYPAIITLSVLNIANKLFGIKMVKVPVYLVFIMSLIGYFW